MDRFSRDASRERHEELIEIIGTGIEKGSTRISDFQADGLSLPVLESLADDGHILIEGENIRLTPKGQREFLNLIRRHRLAERLLFDILKMSDEEGTEEIVCKMEHIISDDFTDAICTLLGHPTTCPHGRPIPPGRCCELRKERVKPLVSNLTQMKPGEKGDIAFISTIDHEKMDRLAGMGLIPGVEIRVHQLHPAVVILFDETTLSMDDDYAKIVYVRRK